MSKDKGTQLPITQLSSLMLNYKDNNSTFSLPVMTTAQRDQLVNIEPYTVGSATYQVKAGTMIFNSETNQLQIFYKGEWYNILNGINDNVLINADNNNNPIAPTANEQLAVFRISGDTQQVVPAFKTDGGTNTPVTLKDVQQPQLRTNKKLQGKIKNNNADPEIYGLSGIDYIDFGDDLGLGFIICDSNFFITLNKDSIAQTDRQNILLSDDQESVDPTTYDAVVEIRSDKGALLLPRLTQEAIDAITTAETPAGMIVYNSDRDMLLIYNGSEWINLDPTAYGFVEGPIGSTTNAIAVFADDTGETIKGTPATINDNGDILTKGSIGIEAANTARLLLSSEEIGNNETQVNISVEEDGGNPKSRVMVTGPNDCQAQIFTLGGRAALQLQESNSDNWFELRSNPNLTQTSNYMVPASLPSEDGQVLTSDVNGNMSWGNIGTSEINITGAVNGSGNGTVNTTLNPDIQFQGTQQNFYSQAVNDEDIIVVKHLIDKETINQYPPTNPIYLQNIVSHTNTILNTTTDWTTQYVSGQTNYEANAYAEYYSFYCNILNNDQEYHSVIFTVTVNQSPTGITDTSFSISPKAFMRSGLDVTGNITASGKITAGNRAEDINDVVTLGQLNDLIDDLKTELTTTPTTGVLSIIHAYVASTYTDYVHLNDHIKFSSLSFTRGENIILDTSSAYTTTTGAASIGRITLLGGKTYKLTGSINNAAANGDAAVQWWNATSNSSIGLPGVASPPSAPVNRSPSAVTVAYFTPTTTTTMVELRIITSTFIEFKGTTSDSLGGAWCTVEEI